MCTHRVHQALVDGGAGLHQQRRLDGLLLAVQRGRGQVRVDRLLAQQLHSVGGQVQLTEVTTVRGV